MLSAPSLNNQYESLENTRPPELPAAEMLRFVGQGERDVYNITAPFEFDGLRLIAGRDETRQWPLKSRIGFYAEQDEVWHKVSQLEHPEHELEDPFITHIDNRLILGAVRVDWSSQPLEFKTVFYDVESLDSFRPIAEGPMGMKDIRLKQLGGGEILVMTRPDRSIPSRIDRQIGFFKISQLDELTPEKIEQEAYVLNGMFAEGEWGGANEIHTINEEWVGVLAHKARWDDFNNLYYTASVFELNHVTGEFTPMRELFGRNDLPEGPTKTDYHRNVVFSGGLVHHGNGSTAWYGGCSDASAGVKTIEYPFRSPRDAFYPTAA